MGMTVYNPNGTVASVFQGIERQGNKLVLKQLALGLAPMDVIITPPESIKALGMVSLGLLTFIILFPCFYFSYRCEEKRKKASPAADKPQA